MHFSAQAYKVPLQYHGPKRMQSRATAFQDFRTGNLENWKKPIDRNTIGKIKSPAKPESRNSKNEDKTATLKNMEEKR